MILFLQTLAIKVRFAWLMVLAFPVLVAQWLFVSAPWALARLQVVSGGAGLPDARFWFTPAELHSRLAAWGDRGREIYLTALWPADTAFLAAYAAFLAAAILYLLRKANPRGSWWYLAALVPVAAAVFDFGENALTVINAFLPATGWEPVAWIEAVCTAGKWTALGLTALFLGGGTAFHLGRSVVRKLRAGRSVPFEPVEPQEPGRN